jgi:sec-independent protein translocase protein TatA
MQTLALFGPIGTWEALALLALGLLIFGRRLPEVGRGLGRSIVEFRKGLQGVENEIDEASKRPTPKRDEVGATRPPLTSAGDDPRVSRSANPVESEPHPAP